MAQEQAQAQTNSTNKKKKEIRVRKLDFKHEVIDASLIDIPEWRVRSYRDEQSEKALKESVKKLGLLHDIIVARKSDGRYELIAGQGRLEALKEQGVRNVPCKVVELRDPSEAYVIQLSENIARGALDPGELIEAIDRLISAGWSLRDIAAICGYSYDRIKHLARLRHAPPPLKMAIAEGSIEPDVAEELLRVKDEEKFAFALEQLLGPLREATKSEKINWIRHAIRGVCDECRREGTDCRKVGDVWLCSECLAKRKPEVAEALQVKEEKGEVYVPCRIGLHDVSTEQVQTLRGCAECLFKLEVLRQKVVELFARPLHQISIDEIKSIGMVLPSGGEQQ